MQFQVKHSNTFKRGVRVSEILAQKSWRLELRLNTEPETIHFVSTTYFELVQTHLHHYECEASDYYISLISTLPLVEFLQDAFNVTVKGVNLSGMESRNRSF